MKGTSGAETAGEGIAVGISSFDANDRLAIMNLINSYGYLSDEFQMDRFFALFTAAPAVEVWFAAERVYADWAQFKVAAMSRQAYFAQHGIQRRHALTAPRFDRSGPDSASGQVYVRVYKTQNGQLSLVTIGFYEFTAVKQRGLWKLDRWCLHLDIPPDKAE